MAISDYLTGSEWDACFYVHITDSYKGRSKNLGDSMEKTINILLKSGYKFQGLDEKGEKKCQVENGINAPKLSLWFGNPDGITITTLLDNGRNFLKQHYPELVGETDEEWKELMEHDKNH